MDLFSHLFPYLYAACFLLLLWQAFKVIGQGFRAVPRPGDRDSVQATGAADRTGRLTIHPELLDAEGQITREDLLTVRFDGDNEPSELQDEAP
ncbi:MAG: DUF2973 domain-containing protein [Prochlorococcaceae cyanobacterium]|jgi:hypothetical protein